MDVTLLTWALVGGAILIWTGVGLFKHWDEDPSPEDNKLVKIIRKRIAMTDEYDGSKIFTRIDGKRLATPMFLVMIAIASTDLLFALDSIPATFGVTQEPFLVFAANAFALLGLRALYFLLKGSQLDQGQEGSNRTCPRWSHYSRRAQGKIVPDC